MDSASCDAHLSTQAIPESVAETRRGIDIDTGTIHFPEEFLPDCWVLCDADMAQISKLIGATACSAENKWTPTVWSRDALKHAFFPKGESFNADVFQRWSKMLMQI